MEAAAGLPDATLGAAALLVGLILIGCVVVLLVRLRAMSRLHTHRAAPIPQSPTMDPTSSDGFPSSKRAPEHPRDEEAGRDGGRDANGGGNESSTPKRKGKMHVFVIIGRDYYQKQCRLAARTVTDVTKLHAALQELFSQELFAAELTSAGRRLLVSDMVRHDHMLPSPLHLSTVCPVCPPSSLICAILRLELVWHAISRTTWNRDSLPAGGSVPRSRKQLPHRRH